MTRFEIRRTLPLLAVFVVGCGRSTPPMSPVTGSNPVAAPQAQQQGELDASNVPTSTRSYALLARNDNKKKDGNGQDDRNKGDRRANNGGGNWHGNNNNGGNSNRHGNGNGNNRRDGNWRSNGDNGGNWHGNGDGNGGNWRGNDDGNWRSNGDGNWRSNGDNWRGNSWGNWGRRGDWWGSNNWWSYGNVNPWWGLGVQPTWWGTVAPTTGRLLFLGGYYYPFYVYGGYYYPDFSRPLVNAGGYFAPVSGTMPIPPGNGGAISPYGATVIDVSPDQVQVI